MRPSVRRSRRPRTSARSALLATVAARRASSVTVVPASRSSSVRNSSIFAATRLPAHESCSDGLSIPKKTGTSGISARMTSLAPTSWMQWSAISTASYRSNRPVAAWSARLRV